MLSGKQQVSKFHEPVSSYTSVPPHTTHHTSAYHTSIHHTSTHHTSTHHTPHLSIPHLHTPHLHTPHLHTPHTTIPHIVHTLFFEGFCKEVSGDVPGVVTASSAPGGHCYNVQHTNRRKVCGTSQTHVRTSGEISLQVLTTHLMDVCVLHLHGCRHELS